MSNENGSKRLHDYPALRDLVYELANEGVDPVKIDEPPHLMDTVFRHTNADHEKAKDDPVYQALYSFQEAHHRLLTALDEAGVELGQVLNPRLRALRMVLRKSGATKKDLDHPILRAVIRFLKNEGVDPEKIDEPPQVQVVVQSLV